MRTAVKMLALVPLLLAVNAGAQTTDGTPATDAVRSGQAASSDTPGRGDRHPDPRGKGTAGGYSIEQAISDRAQLNTIAFSGLAFITGNLGSDTFLPPGKVSDFFGFQYMRDIDANQMGHNTSFLTRIANNVLHVLNEDQRAQLVALGTEQAPQIRQLAMKRFPLIKAFRRQLAGDIPAGSTGLDRDAVMNYSAEIYELDGLLAYRRAEVVGNIIRSLTDEQKAELARLKFGDWRTWPELPDPIDRRSMSHDVHVAVMTYASEMFSWYGGSAEADTYFCPERHGMYFGGFYMKDAPAMGNKNYSISTQLTGDSGEGFLAALTAGQHRLITDLVDLQRKDLAEIVDVRRAICSELRRFMKEHSANKDAVVSLSRRYGQLDGEMAYLYATHFAEVAKTLSDVQRETLRKLRNQDTLAGGAYLYSSPIDMPQIGDTNFLFAAPGASATRPQ